MTEGGWLRATVRQIRPASGTIEGSILADGIGDQDYCSAECLHTAVQVAINEMSEVPYERTQQRSQPHPRPPADRPRPHATTRLGESKGRSWWDLFR